MGDAPKLYAATAYVTVVFEAEDMDDARSRAADYASAEFREGGGWSYVLAPYRVRNVADVPKGWMNSPPWGRFPVGATVRQLLAHAPSAVAARVGTADAPGAPGAEASEGKEHLDDGQGWREVDRG